MKPSQNLHKVFEILIMMFFLQSCGSSSLAPIQERASPPSIKIKYHIVSKGETLYSIAWRYGLDYKRLAQINGVDKQYKIYPGQRLNLSSVVIKTQPNVPKIESPPIRSRPTTPRVRAIPKPVTVHRKFKWTWPVRGKVLSTFSSENGLNKGIDIAGVLGEPVVSAGPGQVVYAGDGLRGYGKLLIIKHSDVFLSAYAHNRKLMVGEGEVVKGGQKIAEVGSSGSDRNKLHFEIRRDGKPVDPLLFLPKRK